MIGGQGSSDQAAARLLAYRKPRLMNELIDLLVATSADYLSLQVDAGADALQIFDSWAGSLPEKEFQTWVVEPTRKLIETVRQRHPGIPIIAFPRGIASDIAETYLRTTGANAIGCDTAMPVVRMKLLQATGKAVQGNLDPLLLVAGGEAMAMRTQAIVEALKGGPFIFNLGHGIVPETPPEHVALLVDIVRGARA
jgi:uroporphyrinogen decarboxylase